MDISTEELLRRLLDHISDHNDPHLSMLDVAYLNRVQTFVKAQSGAYVSLTSASNSIAIDLSQSNNFNHTFTENTTLAAPSNVTAGQSGVIYFTQHASSPKTLAFNSFWLFADGTDPTITATNSAVDIMTYIVNPAGTAAVCSMVLNAS